MTPTTSIASRKSSVTVTHTGSGRATSGPRLSGPRPALLLGSLRSSSRSQRTSFSNAWGGYDVAPDGQRFLMVQKDPVETRPIELVMVPNWLEELKAKMVAAH